MAYKSKDTGEEMASFPASLRQLDLVEVVYKDFEGWNQPTTHAKSFGELPKQAQAYVEFIEHYVGVKVRWIGTGPKREDMIVRY